MDVSSGRIFLTKKKKKKSCRGITSEKKLIDLTIQNYQILTAKIDHKASNKLENMAKNVTNVKNSQT